MTVSGIVNGELEARCALLIRGTDGSENEVNTVIDTGFNGFLTLPQSAVADLELRFIGEGRVILANGQEEVVNLYAVDVFWNGDWKAIEAECTESDPLLGMALLEGFRLSIDVVRDGGVVISSLD
ncbi:MAG: clan AA aspartic protease [Planctomycetaceae bacterium]